MLAHKHNLVSLEIDNIFDRGFTERLKPVSEYNANIFPTWRIMFKLALYF